MGTATGRAYWGDFGLLGSMREPVEKPTRLVLQEFRGVDRKNALVIPASSNVKLELQVATAGAVNTASRTQRGLRGALMEERAQLVLRSLRADPVVWVCDNTRSKLVTSYAAPTITSAAHGYVNGDVVLLRKPAHQAGAFLLGVVSAATANTFQLGSLDPAGTRVPTALDELHLVEAYWRGMVLATIPQVPPGPGDYFAEELVYGFAGAGVWTYHRTSATVGA